MVSIDVGKAANLMVCTANPLQVVNDVVHLFIRGEPVVLESKQTRQAHRYEHRPTPTLPDLKQLVGLPSQTREPQKVAAKRADPDAPAQ